MFAKVRIVYIVALYFTLCSASILFPGIDFMHDWKKFASSRAAEELIGELKKFAAAELAGRNNRKHDRGLVRVKPPPFYGKVGIFITLIKGKRVRGCYGAFDHSNYRLDEILKEYLRGALRYDHRYKPLSIEELDETEIVITITSRPFQIFDINMIDISSYGIKINLEDGSSMVFVPAEIKTVSYIKRILSGRKISGISAFKSITIK